MCVLKYYVHCTWFKICIAFVLFCFLDFDPRKVESPPLPTVTYVWVLTDVKTPSVNISYCMHKASAVNICHISRGHTSCVKKECERSITDVKSSNQEETKLGEFTSYFLSKCTTHEKTWTNVFLFLSADYKNNLLKEAEMSKLCSPKAIDLDRGKIIGCDCFNVFRNK